MKRNQFTYCTFGMDPCSRSELQRYIPMLLRRVFVPLGLQHLQRLDQLLAGLARLNHGIDESAIGGNVGIGEAVAEFFDLLLRERLRDSPH